METKMMTNVTI